MIPTMNVVYVDELWAINALTDALLLWLTARLLEIPPSRGRMALAAGLGGLYAAAAVLPGMGWLTAPGWKLLSSLGLCLTAFGRAALWRSWAAFLCLSALFAGTVLAAAVISGRRLSPSGVMAGISLRMLLLCSGVCWAGVRLFLAGLARRQEGRVLEAALALGSRRVTLRVLRDTGNTLTDPVSGRPVLTADADALSPLLGLPVPEAVRRDPAALVSLLSGQPEMASRLRLVAYSAVGADGLLCCIRPDAARIEGRETRLLIGVSPTPIRGGYDGIF